MKTIVIQVGNTDNKLTQQEWSMFCKEVESIVRSFSVLIHFCGASPSISMYQNFCMVFETVDESVLPMRNNLTTLRKIYSQDSIAFMIGKTEFI